MTKQEAMLRVFDRVAGETVVTDTGCWTLSRARGRYLITKLLYREGSRKMHTTIGLHRLMYLVLVGTVPDGLVLDHLCRYKPCFNPDHLEPVTHAENIRRIPR